MRCAAPLVLLALLLPGCASIWTLADEEVHPFGGVRMDGSIVGGKDPFLGRASFNLRALALLDLPFSLVLDVVTLPYTAPAAALELRRSRTPVVECPSEQDLARFEREIEARARAAAAERARPERRLRRRR